VETDPDPHLLGPHYAGCEANRPSLHIPSIPRTGLPVKCPVRFPAPCAPVRRSDPAPATPSPPKPEAKAVGLKEQSTLPGAGIRGRFSVLRPFSRKLELPAIQHQAGHAMPRMPEAKAVGLREQNTLPGAELTGRFSVLRPLSRKLQLQAIQHPASNAPPGKVRGQGRRAERAKHPAGCWDSRALQRPSPSQPQASASGDPPPSRFTLHAAGKTEGSWGQRVALVGMEEVLCLVGRDILCQGVQFRGVYLSSQNGRCRSDQRRRSRADSS
jgi:hypothetical protein